MLHDQLGVSAEMREEYIKKNVLTAKFCKLPTIPSTFHHFQVSWNLLVYDYEDYEYGDEVLFYMILYQEKQQGIYILLLFFSRNSQHTHPPQKLSH